MRILMVNASPKKNGATGKVLQWMKEALEERYETESVCLGERSIAFCRGCKQCYKTGRCVLPADGMEELLHRMERNDAILFAVPSYWGDVPAQFKALIDRCTPCRHQSAARPFSPCCGKAGICRSAARWGADRRVRAPSAMRGTLERTYGGGIRRRRDAHACRR